MCLALARFGVIYKSVAAAWRMDNAHLHSETQQQILHLMPGKILDFAGKLTLKSPSNPIPHDLAIQDAFDPTQQHSCPVENTKPKR